MINARNTYSYDDEIKPTPSICEVFLEAERQPFDDHLKDEDDCVRLVHILQDSFEKPALGVVQIDVFNSLIEK